MFKRIHKRKANNYIRTYFQNKKEKNKLFPLSNM